MSGKSNDYRKTYEKDHWSALYSKHARLNVRRSDRKASTKKARADQGKTVTDNDTKMTHRAKPLHDTYPKGYYQEEITAEYSNDKK